MATGFFPTLQPDELLYSGCARYFERSGFASVKSALFDLFSVATAGAIVDLPCRLSEFEAALPKGHGYKCERLIDEHTLAPFFCAFLPPERARRIRRDMLGNNGPTLHRRIGLTANRVPFRDRLRFCPLCARGEVDEPYWHRLHQLPGVEVCPQHEVFLEEGEAFTRHDRNGWRLLTACESIRTVPARCVDSENPAHAILLALARDAEWLLNHPGLYKEPNALRNRYLRLMIDRKLATYSGSIRVIKLLKIFKDHVPVPLLKLLNCELAGRDKLKENWLLRLVRQPRHAQHPLHHLLLVNLLGSTAEQFFALPGELKFFGDMPWPCLNPAASHYREDCVTDCRVTFRGKDMRPVGTFTCDCGFIFARTGPDTCSEDRFRIGRMKSFGTVWEDELKRLWRDRVISTSGIARRLEVDPLTVKRYAVRLGLASSERRLGIKQLASELLLKPRKTNTTGDGQRLQKCRDEWLVALKRFGSQGLKKMRAEMPRLYAYLRNHDREWLSSHLPPAGKKRRSSNSVDWVKRDAQLAEAVMRAAEQIKIKGARRRPILISKSAIARALGKTTLLRQKILKLPLTAAALKEVVETRESYAVRRIHWAASRYQAEDTFPFRWQLILRSNVYRLRDSPEVKSAIDNAMHTLEATLHNSCNVTAA